MVLILEGRSLCILSEMAFTDELVNIVERSAATEQMFPSGGDQTLSYTILKLKMCTHSMPCCHQVAKMIMFQCLSTANSFRKQALKN